MARREPWEYPWSYTMAGSTRSSDQFQTYGRCKLGQPMSEELKEEVHRHMEAVAERIKRTGEKPFVITKEMWEGRLAEVTKLIPPPSKVNRKK